MMRQRLRVAAGAILCVWACGCDSVRPAPPAVGQTPAPVAPRSAPRAIPTTASEAKLIKAFEAEFAAAKDISAKLAAVRKLSAGCRDTDLPYKATYLLA